MSSMTISILSATVTTVPTQKGSYQALELAFKNKSFQDKVEGKKIMSFDKMEGETFKKLQSAPSGAVYTIGREKDEKGYWKWTSVTEGASAASTAPSQGASMAAPVATPKSSYETAEERAKRQVMIVRQSSLSSAIAAMKDKGSLKPEDIIEFAKKLEAYVMGIEQQFAPDLESDPI
jgi:hypothetical protein